MFVFLKAQSFCPLSSLAHDLHAVGASQVMGIFFTVYFHGVIYSC